MNRPTVPPRIALKQQARKLLLRFPRPFLAASAVMLALQTALLFLDLYFGAMPGYAYVFPAADYPDPTGISLLPNGVLANLRIDAAGVLLSLPLSFPQLLNFAVIHGIFFLFSMPLLIGILEQYNALLHGEVRRFSTLFRWYLDLRLTAKAVGLGLVLALVKWTARVLGLLPGLLLFLGTSGRPAASAALPLSFLLVFAGSAAAYFCYTLFLPAQYLLARDPNAPLSAVLSAGRTVLRGTRGNYFLFRLSFLLWFAVVNATYGAMALYVLPYFELANLLYLQAAAPAAPPDGRVLL